MVQLRQAVVIILMMSLTSCGFHLRGEGTLPPPMHNILVEGDIDARAFLHEFEYLLLRQGGQTTAHRTEATMILRLDSYQQKSRVVALDSNGYAREKELTVILSYTVLTPQLEVLLSSRQLKLHAGVLVDKDNVIASERAEKETYQQLQQRLASSLLNALRFDLKGLTGNSVDEAGQ